jgi:predicted aminopeptidase
MQNAHFPNGRQPAIEANVKRRSIAILLASLLVLEGCYYVQAARGQYDLMQRRRPVEDVIADASSPEKLRDRLIMVREARQFAVDELLLPDNDSYRSYADLERDYVVWNVIATPEFSLDPRHWCYPVAGCVAYRGYFAEASAKKLADRLASDGFDVMVGGVSAYSTLGRFADPVLNTMMRWNDTDLVATLFHELAHQKLYIKGDTRFNESFATTVADAGLERWLASTGTPADLEAREKRRADNALVLNMAMAARRKLESLYASGLDATAMRERKRQVFEELAKEASRYDGTANGAGYWFSGNLNNARIASIGLYEGRVPAFTVMLDDCGGDLGCFYARAEVLAEMNIVERDVELDRLAARMDQGS